MAVIFAKSNDGRSNMESNKIEMVRKVCQFCGSYDRCTKKCSESGNYTPRKGSCDKWN